MAIPASRIVNVTPRLIAAGGTDLVMNGLLLTTNPLIPLTSFALTFTSADAVGDYFGMTSDEYLFAVRYFLGYDNSFKKPRSLIIFIARSEASAVCPLFDARSTLSDML